MEKPIKIKIIKLIGNMKRTGYIYVRGLHETPKYYLEDEREEYKNPDNWYWREGTSKEDNDFLHVNWISEGTFVPAYTKN